MAARSFWTHSSVLPDHQQPLSSLISNKRVCARKFSLYDVYPRTLAVRLFNDRIGASVPRIFNRDVPAYVRRFEFRSRKLPSSSNFSDAFLDRVCYIPGIRTGVDLRTWRS